MSGGRSGAQKDRSLGVGADDYDGGGGYVCFFLLSIIYIYILCSVGFSFIFFCNLFYCQKWVKDWKT